MKTRSRYSYRLEVRFEEAPSLNTPMPDQLTAVREGWKAAGMPVVTSVRVLRAPEGSDSFVPAHYIKG